MYIFFSSFFYGECFSFLFLFNFCSSFTYWWYHYYYHHLVNQCTIVVVVVVVQCIYGKCIYGMYVLLWAKKKKRTFSCTKTKFSFSSCFRIYLLQHIYHHHHHHIHRSTCTHIHISQLKRIKKKHKI